MTIERRRDVYRALGERQRFAAGVAAALFTALCQVALMGTAAWLLATAWTQPPLLHLGLAIVGVRFFALARAAGRYLERLVSHDAAFRMLQRLRVDVFATLRPALPAGLRLRSTELLPRLVADVERMQDYPLRVLQPLIVAVATAAIATTVVSVIAPAAGAVLAGVLIVSGVLGTWLAVRLADRAAATLGPQSAAFTTALLEHLRLLDVLIAYDREAQSRERLLAADARLARSSRRLALGSGAALGLMTAAGGVAVALTVLATTPAVEAGALGGAMAALVVLVPLALVEIWAVVPHAATALRTVHTAADRIAEASSQAALGISAEGAMGAIPAESGEPLESIATISVTDVRAAWSGARAVGPFSLNASRGETVAIVGQSGVGKSTLAAVFVRFLGYEGSIRLGEQELRDVAADSLRERIVLVEQRPHIFAETLRQNLLFAAPNANDETLWHVVERVGLADWAASRDGLETDLGEGGDLVSGGQAQRIALARALLADPEVLVLDEPTANVDPELATALLRDILSASAESGRTVLVIAHAELPHDLVDRVVALSA